MGKVNTTEELCGAVFFRKPYELDAVVSAFQKAIIGRRQPGAKDYF